MNRIPASGQTRKPIAEILGSDFDKSALLWGAVRLIIEEELDELKQTIKEGIPEWVATMMRYDDPSITDMEDVWGI